MELLLVSMIKSSRFCLAGSISLTFFGRRGIDRRGGSIGAFSAILVFVSEILLNEAG